MSKKTFVQSGMIRLAPKIEAAGDAIKYFERLWDVVTEHGYGEAKQAKLSDKIDGFKALNPRQKKWFTGFWNAFSYKHGRNEAAHAWMQMGEKTDQEYRQIIDAASKESQRMVAAGSSRMMAQGWINNKRYQDYEPQKSHLKPNNNQILNQLNSELNAVKKLHQVGGDEALLQQIEKLENKIKDVRR